MSGYPLPRPPFMPFFHDTRAVLPPPGRVLESAPPQLFGAQVSVTLKRRFAESPPCSPPSVISCARLDMRASAVNISRVVNRSGSNTFAELVLDH